MKITILHYAAQPVVGGVERVIGNHARLLSDHGHRVQIVAGRGAQVDPRISFAEVPLADSLHPSILSLKAELDKGILPKGFAHHSKKLEETLSPLFADADVVIAHNVSSLGKNLPLTAALESLFRSKLFPSLILWHHDIAWLSPRYRHELHPGYPWELLRTHWPGVRHVTISEWRQSQLAKLLDLSLEDIRVIPGGVDRKGLLNITSDTRRLIEQLGLLEASPLFLLPVRLTRRKNIETALHVLAKLQNSSYPQAQLVVTGPPGPHNPANKEYFQFLTELCQQLDLERSAHFLAHHSEEYFPDHVISDLYRMADVLILTSVEEGFGLPLLEAGITKLPIFCSDIPPLREIGQEEVTYFSLDSSPDEIAGTIINGLQANHSFKLRSRIQQKYTWERVYAQIADELLNEPDSQAKNNLTANQNGFGTIQEIIFPHVCHPSKGQSKYSQQLEDWLQTNTYQADQFSNLDELVKQKQLQKQTISVILPTLNVAHTLDEIIQTLQRTMIEQVPLIDEIVLIDSDSTDQTRKIAENLGVPVFNHRETLPVYGARTGKGEALWKSLYLTHGDILIWIDTDNFEIHPRFIYGLLGPLLMNASLKFVKGFYRRPLKLEDRLIENAGGRVTELVARPLLNLYYPELSGILQPLAGEFAGRRTVLEQLPFFSGYGVDIGLLLDVFRKFGLASIAQVDLYRRVHYNKPLSELSKMSFAVIQAFMSLAEHKLGQGVVEQINRSIILRDTLGEDLKLDSVDICEEKRPPMFELPEYHARS
jgi:glycosyltransferase involved in cell wall biosynthesis